MDKAAFETLLSAVIDNPNKSGLDELKKQLSSCGNPLGEEVSSQLELLWECWSADALDTAQADVCVLAAEQGVSDRPAFRKLLVQAVKTLLPNDLGHNPVMRALGIRDEKTPLPEVAARLRTLLAIKSGSVLFFASSGRWGVAGSIDAFGGTMPVSSFRGLGINSSTPLDQVLKNVVVLELDGELDQLVRADNVPVSASRFREIVKRRAKVAVTEEQMRAMAVSGCGRKMNTTAFEAYWSAKAQPAAAGGTRKSWQGRSILEIGLLLETEEKNGENTPYGEEECSALRDFFTRMRAETAAREGKQLAELVSKVASRCTGDSLHNMLEPLIAKATFWPLDPAAVSLESLSVWGEASAKSLEGLANVSAQAFSEEYLAKCMLRLPLKALNAIGGKVSDEMLYDVVCESKTLSSDILLWIWKNRKKRYSEELISLLTVENVCRVLGGADVPKAWGPARRELRTLLMDNADFQKLMIESAGNDAMMFASVLQGALFLSTSERQSLMVKLSRISPVLQEYLESGAGQRILKAGIGEADAGDAPEEIQPNYTSIRSQKLLEKELNDIITIHVPENREALKAARAHGDFRENSEFDAAKERRNYLSRRRSELERELAKIQPVVMGHVTVDKTAVIGSEIDLEYSDGAVETYSLLGAWDGDPDRKFLSYRTRLGEAVLNCKVGDSFQINEKRSCKLVAVRPLSAELIAELDA